MKKFICVLSIILCVGIIMGAFFISHNYFKDFSNYKNEEGYKEYINDTGSDYKDLPYYDCSDTMRENKKVFDYYNNNSRTCGDYIITNYRDGVCINRFVGFRPWEDGTLEIPETLEGKPVIKIGAYPKDSNDIDSYVCGAFAGCRDYTLKIPSTVKYIDLNAFMCSQGMIPEDCKNDFTMIDSIEVDANNNYYASKDGALYTKDMKKLLYDPKLNWYYPTNEKYVVPDFVEVFEPSNGVYCLLESITISKNVKEIHTYINNGEDGIEPNPEIIPEVVVRGYKGTAAEKWAKEQYAKFEALD